MIRIFCKKKHIHNFIRKYKNENFTNFICKASWEKRKYPLTNIFRKLYQKKFFKNVLIVILVLIKKVELYVEKNYTNSLQNTINEYLIEIYLYDRRFSHFGSNKHTIFS
ncbi:hypothetical protein EDEG_03924 [Edhazardia aedis USNM 41457]|uniref:Uncharacterized protein n=1 Tax=Edhazardia aedis (strain USNM 41457) TaxID=1003232 RepID=J9D0V1_EDHAE|nr:hypothetical protein EDEG_03924 [Edhazardia aedis USNM 41457]|eukprot:EJW01496.1 hypothetical protein EDEG_03924 [Edhazardia aedis USNM 41457]